MRSRIIDCDLAFSDVICSSKVENFKKITAVQIFFFLHAVITVGDG